MMELRLLWCLSLLVTCAYCRRSKEQAVLFLNKSVSILDTLSTILQLQQLSIQQTERLSGSSGVVRQRMFDKSTASFLKTFRDHYLPGIYSLPHVKGVLGLKGMRVVMNGVQFRTGITADYQMLAESPQKHGQQFMLPIRVPPVPSAVMDKTTVAEQIVEMRHWMKAWAEQNMTSRNYVPYFKPILCYMEGYWGHVYTRPGKPQQFNRTNEAYMASFGGYEGLTNHTAYLPRILWYIDANKNPVMKQWRYRIKCHIIQKNLPLKYFRVVDDLHVRLSLGMTRHQYEQSEYARFTLNTGKHAPGVWTELDDLMAEVPGRDGYRKKAFRNSPYYYHRWYHHLGVKERHLPFSDESVYVAETTDPNVVPMSFTCKQCRPKKKRLTYAIPLEVVYLTPLHSWNPYNIQHVSHRHQPSDTRTLIASANDFYQTPFHFFTNVDPSLVKTHGANKVVASGFYVILPPIAGIGPLRTRYPIMPIHEETSRLWKKMEALKAIALEPSKYRNMFYENFCDLCH